MAGVAGAEGHDSHSEHATNDGVDTAAENAVSVRGQEYHEKGLESQLRRKDRSAIKESRKHQGNEEDDAGLPETLAKNGEKDVAYCDAKCATYGNFERAPNVGVRAEAQSNERAGGSKERTFVAQQELREPVSADRADGGLDDLGHGIADAQEASTCTPPRELFGPDDRGIHSHASIFPSPAV